MQKRAFFLTHSPISAHFAQNTKDFVVEEIPLYEFSGSGEHLILTVRKKGLSTWQMCEEISERVGVKVRDIGYAGLKDKNAMTVQNISLPAKFAKAVENFSHPAIKILSTTRHNNKIKLGHLKGNRFFIRLKKVNKTDAQKLSSALDLIRSDGMPNYFGFQRFGREGDNYKKAKAMLSGDAKIRGKKMQNFLISALQSERFNAWLNRRIEISHLVNGFDIKELGKALEWDKESIEIAKKQSQFFKLLRGDVMNHYPYGRLYYAEDPVAEAERFKARDTAPTGILSGYRSTHAKDLAGEIEQEFFEDIPASGDRRYAWVFPEVESGKYIEENAHFELAFSLPKGSYATSLIEELLHDELKPTSEDEE